MPPVLKRFIYFAEKSRPQEKERAKLLPQFLEAGKKTSPFLFVSCISVDFVSFKSKLIERFLFLPFLLLTLTHNIGKNKSVNQEKVFINRRLKCKIVFV
jgi:hypothetical protein